MAPPKPQPAHLPSRSLFRARLVNPLLCACLLVAAGAVQAQAVQVVVADRESPVSGAADASIDGEIRPDMIAVDHSGKLYFRDIDDGYAIRKADPQLRKLSYLKFDAGPEGADAPETSGGESRLAGGIDGMVFDDAGDMYFSSRDRNQIFKYSPASGRVTHVAGTGEQGSSGDGGPATAAAMSWPGYLALDQAGNLYVATTGQVRKINEASGVISTVTGSSEGEGIYAGDDGPAIKAGFSAPLSGIGLDGAGNLYIASSMEINGAISSSIRKVDAKSGIITRVAGVARAIPNGSDIPQVKDGARADSGPIYLIDALAADKAGNLYFASESTQSIRRIDAQSNIVTTLAGLAQDAAEQEAGYPLYFPLSLTIDDTGNLYVAEAPGGRILKIPLAASSAD